MLSAAGGCGEDEDELERRRMDSLWCAEVGRCVGRLLLKLNIVVRAADFVYEMLHLGTRGHDREARCPCCGPRKLCTREVVGVVVRPLRRLSLKP